MFLQLRQSYLRRNVTLLNQAQYFQRLRQMLAVNPRLSK